MRTLVHQPLMKILTVAIGAAFGIAACGSGIGEFVGRGGNRAAAPRGDQ